MAGVFVMLIVGGVIFGTFSGMVGTGGAVGAIGITGTVSFIPEGIALLSFSPDLSPIIELVWWIGAGGARFD